MRGLHAARAALVLAAGLGTCGQSAAGDVPGGMAALGLPQPLILSEFGEAKMPSGLASLCLREPALCAPVTPVQVPRAFSAAERDLITQVNTAVNHAIRPSTDEKLYGRVEYWTMPADAGDCEDYVLLKRKMLSERGIPLASLLITVVQDENGEAHAVLSIPATEGDLVLDNRRDEVLHWLATGYSFIRLQLHKAAVRRQSCALGGAGARKAPGHEHGVRA
jgi:predicted transglutaminase-like cysteine proteinase